MCPGFKSLLLIVLHDEYIGAEYQLVRKGFMESF